MSRWLIVWYLWLHILSWGLFCQPVYFCGHFPSPWHVHGSTPTGVFKGECQPLTHSSLGFPFHFSFFVASSLNLWGWWHVWSVTPWGNPVDGRGDCFHLHCQDGGWDCKSCTVFNGWWLHLAWQWSPTMTGLWWLSHQCTLWLIRSCSSFFFF